MNVYVFVASSLDCVPFLYGLLSEWEAEEQTDAVLITSVLLFMKFFLMALKVQSEDRLPLRCIHKAERGTFAENGWNLST